jgi:hypothetical protein
MQDEFGRLFRTRVSQVDAEAQSPEHP